MVGKRIQLGQRLLLILLGGVVAGQVAFVLWGGPQRILSISRLEQALPVQGGIEERPEVDDGLLARPAPPEETPVVAGGPLPPGAEVEAPGGPSLGSIPVAFGENAPSEVPARAGMPRPGGPPSDESGQVGGNSSWARPMARRSGDGQPGAGGGNRPPGNDSYRQALLSIYHLEKKGGGMALTQAQARHLLELVRQMEDLKGAVPEARRLLLETFTPEQIETLQARRAALLPDYRPPPPGELDRDAQRALDRLGK